MRLQLRPAGSSLALGWALGWGPNTEYDCIQGDGATSDFDCDCAPGGEFPAAIAIAIASRGWVPTVIANVFWLIAVQAGRVDAFGSGIGKVDALDPGSES